MVKRLLCIIAVLCMSLQLFAYDFSVVNSDGVTIYYTITSSTAPLTVEVVKNGVNTYSGEVNIPSTVTHGGNTYSVTSIGVDAFYPCSGLTKVTIPNSVLNIRTRAFYMCSNLTSITIPNSVTTIGDWAFGDCSKIKSVFIPNSVTSIGDNPFVSDDLDTVIVASGNTAFDSRDNCNAIIQTSTNKLVTGCKRTIIPNTVTTIGAAAFKWCLGLTNIVIPSSVTYIGDEAFQYCM